MSKTKTEREAEKILRQGGVGVMATDTIYGIVGSALLPKTVVRIYKLRKRRPDKPMIILIGSVADLKKFGVKIDSKALRALGKFWPGKVSIILPCKHKKFFYLHRGANALAFRLPRKKNLREFLARTGPLVAPSANLEGKPPATTIAEAQRYFSSKADFYLDAGKISAKPSRLIGLTKGKVFILRK